MEKTETLSYKLDVFEGPLDLLLNLIAKNKLNIYDIPIAELLEQYMAQIHEMQAADMDVASEFLEMAARLVHIKSVSLLPKKEEEAALKQELTGQLLEYQQCKEAAMRLRERFSLDSIVRAQADIPADLTYKRHHKPQELLSAYLSMLGKKEAAGAAEAGGHHLKAHHAPCGLRGFANCFRAAQPVEKAACVVKRVVPRQKRPFGARGGVPRRFGACQGQAIARGR